ncbi:hypothetical protein HMPREF0494_0020 [Limosilactobacillus antri DSM 16041]|uniref:Uncharacterized protein n=1 Tax=Limosilactobacillus antri DSM 16041 TaxID=525309 RepID=C8P3V9_9LACO|nr:hypothetical protein HMPREF0494_0020 [Limosilactobacillus antri DSM 16041]
MLMDLISFFSCFLESSNNTSTMMLMYKSSQSITYPNRWDI